MGLLRGVGKKLWGATGPVRAPLVDKAVATVQDAVQPLRAEVRHLRSEVAALTGRVASLQETIDEAARVAWVTIDGQCLRSCRVRPAGYPEFRLLLYPTANEGVSEACVRGYVEKDPLFQVMRALVKPGLVALDLGANIGVVSLALAVLGVQVISVEPARENLTLLRLSAKHNRCEDRVTVVAAAVAESRRTLRFREYGPYGHVHTEFHGPTGPEVDVQGTSGDDLVAEHGVKPGLIKLDIEGYEMFALRGMRTLLGRDDAPAMICESNAFSLAAFGATPAQLRTELAQHGYTLYVIRPGLLVPTQPDHPQLHVVADLLAIKGTPPLPEGWRIGTPTVEEDAALFAQEYQAGDVHRRHIAAAAREMLPLHGHPRIAQLLDQLARDDDEPTRRAAAWWADKKRT